MAKDYKNKKGATGKKYTTVGDVIKVTYTDGSTRVVRPTDASYAVTKKAMQDDISSKKLFKSGNSKTTAQTALGANNAGAGVVTTAKQKAQQDNYRNVVNQRRAQEAQQRAVTEMVRKGGYSQPSAKKPVLPDVTATSPLLKDFYKAPNVPVVQNMKNDSLPDAFKYGVRTGVNGIVGSAPSTMYGAAKVMADVTGNGKLSSEMEWNMRLASAKQQLEQERINSGFNTNFTGLAKGVSDVTAGAIGMVPTVAAFALTPQGKIAAAGKAAQIGAKALGYAPLALQAGGGGINQALNDGASANDSLAYGLGNVAKEVGTEALFGGIGKIPAFVDIGESVAKRVANETAKKIAVTAGRVASEGAEEAVAEIVDPFLKNATYSEGEEIDWNDVGYSALIGAGTAGALNAGIKAAEIGAKSMPNYQKVVQNDASRAFESLHGQKMGQNEAQIAQKPQIAPEQAQNNATTKGITAQPEVAQEQSSQADFQQNQAKIVQEAQPVKNVQKGGKKAAFTSMEMAERTFENVKDKNVLAYQQQNPEVKPYQQDVASRLLYDLQMGEQGRREYGIDAETRNVTTMQGISRSQSEPIERMLQDGMSYKQIKDGLNRIVEDNGKENTANAKRAELYVNDAVRNGYRSIAEGDVAADRTYAYRGMNAEQLQQEFDRVMAAVGDESYTDEQRQQLLAQADATVGLLMVVAFDFGWEMYFFACH